MSSISAVSGGAGSAIYNAGAAQKSGQAAAAANSTKRDADGDFDNTAPGQTDPLDAGKGRAIDVRG
jgi:hypothetical protein